MVALPEIHQFKLQENSHDFIILCSDGVFDKFTTSELIQFVWKQFDIKPNTVIPRDKKSLVNMSIHEICGYMAELILKESMARESLDNLSVVFIAFKNFQKYIDMFQ